MTNTSFEQVKDAINDVGYKVESYSGRCMYGKHCIAVMLEGDGELWDLANRLGQNGFHLISPHLDNMGRGIVAYWPDIKWEGPLSDEEDDDEENS